MFVNAQTPILPRAHIPRRAEGNAAPRAGGSDLTPVPGATPADAPQSFPLWCGRVLRPSQNRRAFAAHAPGSRICRAPARRRGTIARQDHQCNANMPFKQPIGCNLSRVSDPEQALNGDAIDDRSPPQYDNSSAQSGASDRLIRFPLGRRPSRSEENTIRHRR